MSSTKMITVEEEFKKNPELKESDLEILREWCKKQPHLPKIADIDLILILHSNYYLIEPSKRTIDNYFTMRTHVPEFFSNRDVLNSPSLRKQLDIAVYMPLKGLSKKGYNIIYSRLIDYEPSHFVHPETEKAYNMMLDIWLWTEGTVKGHVILIDMHGSQMGHVSRMNPSVAKKSLLYLQDALPVRLKEIHVMNVSPIFDLMMMICRPFMKKELLDMLHLHTTKESLEEYIPLEILPNEAGGKAGPLSKFYDDRMKLLTEFRDWFIEDEKSGRVNENLRPGKSKNAGEVFGVEGSFKKLDID
ncbi:alpha-tocopherol transfer protein-like [Leptopilina heterotoma]|uniref:alpha-tocopherol transfer protein-like n=1 Tax=Leptopilina heterotoma TaxID=63436 RepID=UPI001CA898F7|nr:alpha-tocopherol transfer protein-like [Leptopilina heterotoma]